MKNSTARILLLFALLISLSKVMEAQVKIDLETMKITGFESKLFEVQKYINFEINNIWGDSQDSLTITYSSYNYDHSGLQNTFTSLLGVAGTEMKEDSNTKIDEFFFNQDMIGLESDTCQERINEQIDSLLQNGVYFPYDSSSKYSLREIGEFIQDKYSDFKFSELSDSILTNKRLWTPIKTYHKLPIQIADADVSKIEIKRYKRRSNIVLETQTFEYHNKGGFGKIDFSAGFFGTGLVNEQYSLLGTITHDTIYHQENFISTDSITAINPVSKNKIIREEAGDFRVGIGVLAHYHTRHSNCWNIGVSAGFEIDSEVKVGYLAGLSLLLGKKQRFIITGGAAFGQVKEISNRYNENELIDPSIAADQILRNVWKRSWFTGISYNF